MTDITLPRAELEQALDALEGIQWPGSPSFVKAAITALRDRLAQPEQEPIKESSVTHSHLWIGELWRKEKNT